MAANTVLVSEFVKNAIVDGIVTDLAGTTGVNGTADLYLYTGSAPADADSATTGDLVCTVSNVAWSAGTGGTSTLIANKIGTALIDGTIGYGRFRTTAGDGSHCLDGTAGTGSTNAFVITPKTVLLGEIVVLTSADLVVG